MTHPLLCRGEMSDIVLMEGRGFGFVTYTDPQCAQAFLEVTELHRATAKAIVHAFSLL